MKYPNSAFAARWSVVMIVAACGSEPSREDLTGWDQWTLQATCDQCTLGATRCIGSGVSTCKTMASGCTDWDTPAACTSPPPSTCLDDSTLDVVAPIGSCASGSCTYPSTPQVCSVGSCSQGACGMDVSVLLSLPRYAVISQLGSADDGRLCVGGDFTTTTDFGDGVPIAPLLGQADAFVACYRATGALIWVKIFASQNPDGISALVVQGDGTVYVAGEYYAYDLLTPAQLSNLGGDDIFIAQIHADGSIGWVNQRSSFHADYATDLHVAPTGEVVMSGITSTWIEATDTQAHSWIVPADPLARLAKYTDGITFLVVLDPRTGAYLDERVFKPALNAEPPIGMNAFAFDPAGWLVVAQPAWISNIDASWATTRLLSRYHFPSAPIAAVQSLDLTAHGVRETGWLDRTYKILDIDAAGTTTTFASFSHQVRAPMGGFSLGAATLGWSQLCYSDLVVNGVPHGQSPPAACLMAFSPTGALRELHALRGAGTDPFEGLHAVHQGARRLFLAAGLSGVVDLGTSSFDAGDGREVVLQRAPAR